MAKRDRSAAPVPEDELGSIRSKSSRAFKQVASLTAKQAAFSQTVDDSRLFAEDGSEVFELEFHGEGGPAQPLPKKSRRSNAIGARELRMLEIPRDSLSAEVVVIPTSSGSSTNPAHSLATDQPDRPRPRRSHSTAAVSANHDPARRHTTTYEDLPPHLHQEGPIHRRSTRLAGNRSTPVAPPRASNTQDPLTTPSSPKLPEIGSKTSRSSDEIVVVNIPPQDDHTGQIHERLPMAGPPAIEQRTSAQLDPFRDVESSDSAWLGDGAVSSRTPARRSMRIAKLPTKPQANVKLATNQSPGRRVQAMEELKPRSDRKRKNYGTVQDNTGVVRDQSESVDHEGDTHTGRKTKAVKIRHEDTPLRRSTRLRALQGSVYPAQPTESPLYRQEEYVSSFRTANQWVDPPTAAAEHGLSPESDPLPTKSSAESEVASIAASVRRGNSSQIGQMCTQTVVGKRKRTARAVDTGTKPITPSSIVTPIPGYRTEHTSSSERIAEVMQGTISVIRDQSSTTHEISDDEPAPKRGRVSGGSSDVSKVRKPRKPRNTRVDPKMRQRSTRSQPKGLQASLQRHAEVPVLEDALITTSEHTLNSGPSIKATGATRQHLNLTEVSADPNVTSSANDATLLEQVKAVWGGWRGWIQGSGSQHFLHAASRQSDGAITADGRVPPSVAGQMDLPPDYVSASPKSAREECGQTQAEVCTSETGEAQRTPGHTDPTEEEGQVQQPAATRKRKRLDLLTRSPTPGESGDDTTRAGKRRRSERVAARLVSREEISIARPGSSTKSKKGIDRRSAATVKTKKTRERGGKGLSNSTVRPVQHTVSSIDNALHAEPAFYSNREAHVVHKNLDIANAECRHVEASTADMKPGKDADGDEQALQAVCETLGQQPEIISFPDASPRVAPRESRKREHYKEKEDTPHIRVNEDGDVSSGVAEGFETQDRGGAVQGEISAKLQPVHIPSTYHAVSSPQVSSITTVPTDNSGSSHAWNHVPDIDQDDEAECETGLDADETGVSQNPASIGLDRVVRDPHPRLPTQAEQWYGASDVTNLKDAMDTPATIPVPDAQIAVAMALGQDDSNPTEFPTARSYSPNPLRCDVPAAPVTEISQPQAERRDDSVFSATRRTKTGRITRPPKSALKKAKLRSGRLDRRVRFMSPEVPHLDSDCLGGAGRRIVELDDSTDEDVSLRNSSRAHPPPLQDDRQHLGQRSRLNTPESSSIAEEKAESMKLRLCTPWTSPSVIDTHTKSMRTRRASPSYPILPEQSPPCEVEQHVFSPMSLDSPEQMSSPLRPPTQSLTVERDYANSDDRIAGTCSQALVPMPHGAGQNEPSTTPTSSPRGQTEIVDKKGSTLAWFAHDCSSSDEGTAHKRGEAERRGIRDLDSASTPFYLENPQLRMQQQTPQKRTDQTVSQYHKASTTQHHESQVHLGDHSLSASRSRPTAHVSCAERRRSTESDGLRSTSQQPSHSERHTARDSLTREAPITSKDGENRGVSGRSKTSDSDTTVLDGLPGDTKLLRSSDRHVKVSSSLRDARNVTSSRSGRMRGSERLGQPNMPENRISQQVGRKPTPVSERCSSELKSVPTDLGRCTSTTATVLTDERISRSTSSRDRIPLKPPERGSSYISDVRSVLKWSRGSKQGDRGRSMLAPQIDSPHKRKVTHAATPVRSEQTDTVTSTRPPRTQRRLHGKGEYRDSFSLPRTSPQSHVKTPSVRTSKLNWTSPHHSSTRFPSTSANSQISGWVTGKNYIDEIKFQAFHSRRSTTQIVYNAGNRMWLLLTGMDANKVRNMHSPSHPGAIGRWMEALDRRIQAGNKYSIAEIDILCLVESVDRRRCLVAARLKMNDEDDGIYVCGWSSKFRCIVTPAHAAQQLLDQWRCWRDGHRSLL